MAKMIVQADRKIKTSSLYKLYGELQAQESMVMKDCMDLGGSLALVAHSLQCTNRSPQYPYTEELSYQNPYDVTLHTYEPRMQHDEEEAFQHALTVVSQQFNMHPPTNYCKNQQFTKPPFNRRYNSQNKTPHHHYPQLSRYPRNPPYQPQSQNTPLMLTKSTEAPKEDKSFDTVDDTAWKKEGVLICRKCHKENHFARDCKANVAKDKAFYLRMVQEAEDKEKVIEKAFTEQVRRDHQVWSSRDEDDDNDNKRK